MLLDLTPVPFIDSSGLGVIVRGRRLFDGFAVRGLNSSTQQVFTATGLDLTIRVEG